MNVGQLGDVDNCTLANAINITVDCREYCAVLKTDLFQGNETFEECNSLNARLVLPRNKKEGTEFLKFSPDRTWIGLWNANNTLGRENWRNTNGTEPKYANLRVNDSIKFVFVINFFVYKIVDSLKVVQNSTSVGFCCLLESVWNMVGHAR